MAHLKAPKGEQSPVYNNRTLLLYEQHHHLASVDTIKLSTNDFHIDASSPIQVQPHTISLSGESEERTPLFRDSSGKEHFGQKAFLNSDKCQLTVKNGYLFIQTNINKLSHYYQLQTDRSRRESDFRSLTHEVQEAGIDCDFDEMSVSRLDLCKQKPLQHTLRTYHTVFSALSAKRQMSRMHGDTFLFMNKSRATQFYDKGAEQDIPDVQNLIRAETQLRNSKTVQRHTPFKTLSQVLRAETEELTAIYNRQLQDTIFAKTKDDVDISQDLQLIKMLQERYPRAFIDKYLSLIGIPELIRRYQTVDAFCDALLQIGVERTAVYRRKKSLSAHYQHYQLLMEQAKKESERLYSEIYSFAA